ncbi:gnat family protein [Fusarium mexicanum]|uniref:Gnat family protein n=1 Tax=Fusarium mexicanum TaxID=751941 RepID=A0A8H5J8C0_9HYPO|nr:gnat family protein [Fusarium mexicanum]
MAVRLAKASDLAATSRIAFRGFSLSPWNAFYRPFASTYPQDVEKSYLREQQEALGDPSKLFTVVELQSEQVVGFAIWNYAQQQQRKSDTIAIDLADEKVSILTEPASSSAPQKVQFKSMALTPLPIRESKPADTAYSRYLGGHMELDNMAVDPDHFRKGYGTLLCRHGMEIAREDKVAIGVIAAELGMKLYESLVWACTTKVSLTDGRPDEDASVDFWVQEWNSKEN